MTVDSVTRDLPDPFIVIATENPTGSSGTQLIDQVNPVMTEQELRDIRQYTEQVFVHESIYEYIVTLVEETRRNELFDMGASPRATIALLRIARAMAVLHGREYVTAQDVQMVMADVLGHRVKCSARTKADGLTTAQTIQRLQQQVKAPRI